MSRKRRQLITKGLEERGEGRYRTRELAVEFPIGAAVVDISESGMGIESSQQLRVGASYVFRVRMGERNFGLPGKVEWCRLTGTAPEASAECSAVYRAGVSFASGPARSAWSETLRMLIDAGLQPIAADALI